MNILLVTSFTLAGIAFLGISEKRKNMMWTKISVSILVLLYMLSSMYDVFLDQVPYFQTYEELSLVGWGEIFSVSSFEVGWTILNKLTVDIFGANPRILMAACSIILAVCFFFAYREYSAWPALSAFLYLTLGFWGMCCTVLRQALSMSIAVFSYKYILQRKPGKFILVVLLSACFHNSALFMLLLYPISKLKFNVKYFLGVIVSSAAVLLVADDVVRIVSKIFNKQYEVSPANNWVTFVAILTVSLIEVFIYVKFFEDDKTMHMFCHMTMIASISYLISISNHSFARIAYYFLTSQLFIIPYIIKKLFARKDAVIVTFAVMAVSIFYYAVILNFNDGAMNAYKFFWQ